MYCKISPRRWLTVPLLDDPLFRPLLQASQKIDLLVGFVEEDARNRFYIAAAYLSKGEVRHVHRKVYLPTYGLFERGVFLPGEMRYRPLKPALAAPGY